MAIECSFCTLDSMDFVRQAVGIVGDVVFGQGGTQRPRGEVRAGMTWRARRGHALRAADIYQRTVRTVTIIYQMYDDGNWTAELYIFRDMGARV